MEKMVASFIFIIVLVVNILIPVVVLTGIAWLVVVLLKHFAIV